MSTANILCKLLSTMILDPMCMNNFHHHRVQSLDHLLCEISFTRCTLIYYYYRAHKKQTQYFLKRKLWITFFLHRASKIFILALQNLFYNHHLFFKINICFLFDIFFHFIRKRYYFIRRCSSIIYQDKRLLFMYTRVSMSYRAPVPNLV